jgi:SAM-dependent methyltransferase
MRILPWRVLYFLRARSERIYRLLRFGRWNPNTRRYWDSKYSSDHGFHEDHQSFLHEPVLARVPGATVLDLGCGVGVLLDKLRRTGRTPVGIDLSSVALGQCREKGFEVFAARLPDLGPVAGHEFGAVTCLETLEHLDDVDVVLRAARSVLVAGGVFICTVPRCESPEDALSPARFDEHVQAFSLDSLRERLSGVFQGVEVTSIEGTDGKRYLIGAGFTGPPAIPDSSGRRGAVPRIPRRGA